MPWFVNDKGCGALISDSASAPKSSSGVDGARALNPMPVMGKANVVSPSALMGLLTINVAVKGNGQSDGATPPSAADGSHGQLCCGEKEIVIVQLCCGVSENVDPGALAQLSCVAKFGSLLKSLTPKGLVFPD
jgi:hypothetical protein